MQPSSARQVAVPVPMLIVAHARNDEMARRLATIPGIGPITLSLIAATVGDNIAAFWSARHFAAWLGLVPRQHSTGGQIRLTPRPDTLAQTASDQTEQTACRRGGPYVAASVQRASRHPPGMIRTVLSLTPSSRATAALLVPPDTSTSIASRPPDQA